MRPDSLSRVERIRVPRDLIYWKTELERTNGTDTQSKQTTFIAVCLAMIDQELIDF